MIRVLPLLCVALFSSIAAAQTIYIPPPRVEINPYYGTVVDPWAIGLIRAMHYPRYEVALVQPEGGTVIGTTSGLPTSRYVLVRDPLELGIDPITGEPLFFRKRDIMPPATQPARPAAGATSAPPVNAPKGEIRITPWRGPSLQRVQATASR